MRERREKHTPVEPEPAWPIIVFERGTVEVYDRDWWYGDADLCDAGTWDDSANAIDCEGQVFRIEHRVLRRGRWLRLVPYEEGTNVFVPTGQYESADSVLHRLRSIVAAPVTDQCAKAAGAADSGQAIRDMAMFLYNSL